MPFLFQGRQSIRIKSYRPATGARALRNFISRPISCNSRTSAKVRSSLPGMTAKFPSGADTIVSAAVASPSKTSQVEFSTSALLIPQPIVALPCGSISIKSTRRCVAASEAARFTQVVVFPTPPFWFAMAIIRVTVFLNFPFGLRCQLFGSSGSTLFPAKADNVPNMRLEERHRQF